MYEVIYLSYLWGVAIWIFDRRQIYQAVIQTVYIQIKNKGRRLYVGYSSLLNCMAQQAALF